MTVALPQSTGSEDYRLRCEEAYEGRERRRQLFARLTPDAPTKPYYHVINFQPVWFNPDGTRLLTPKGIPTT